MTDPLKMAFILPGDGPSGGVRSSVAVANGLAERGHAVRILYYKGGGPRAMLRNALRDVLHWRAGNWLSHLKCSARSFSAIEGESFDPGEIVVGMGLWSCRELRKVQSAGLVKVHYLHGEVPWDREFMRAAWSEPVPKIAVASYLAETVRQLCDQEITAVVPNGVDTTQYFPTASVDWRDGVGTIYGPGRHKDPETILAVLKGLRQLSPKPTVRVFGSVHRPNAMEVDEYTRLPSIERAREIYSRSRVWLLCSLSEGFGMPILEAMACGCAVVATDCGGPKDIIRHGENGFLVDVGDVEQMVEQVRLLLNDAALCRSIAERGRRTAERFSWDHCVDRLESVLLSIHDGVGVVPQ